MTRWGIIGVGNIAQRFIKSLSHSNNGKLVAIASKKEEVRKQFSSITAYDNYNDLLDDENVDAVYIALPHNMHTFWCIEALKHKKAVLCEKPVALTKDEIQTIIECAKENNTFFMEAMKTKFVPAFLKLKEKMMEFDLNDISTIHINMCSDSLNKIHPSSYFFDPKQGGTWNDLGSYLIAFLNTFVKDEIKNIKTKTIMNGFIDVHTEVKLTYDNKHAYLFASNIKNKERTATIQINDTEVIIPMFNRPESFIITNKSGSTTFEYPLLFDDFYNQIEEVHTCLRLEHIQSCIHSFADMINDVSLLENVRLSMHNDKKDDKI